MPELGIFDPIFIVTILCVLDFACQIPESEDEVEVVFRAVKYDMAGALKCAASHVVRVEHGDILFNRYGHLSRWWSNHDEHGE